MPRVPWDDINKRYKSNRIDEKKELEKKSVEIKPKEFNLMQDLTDVSRLVAFGVIVSAKCIN